MRAILPIRKLAWDEKIQEGDFHALLESPTIIFPLAGTEAIGKSVTQWRRETGVGDREFFRVAPLPRTAIQTV